MKCTRFRVVYQIIPKASAPTLARWTPVLSRCFIGLTRPGKSWAKRASASKTAAPTTKMLASRFAFKMREKSILR